MASHDAGTLKKRTSFHFEIGDSQENLFGGGTCKMRFADGPWEIVRVRYR